MNNNYMIAVDENGTPYIAHADGLFSKVRQKGAKYYQKIKTAWGTRYFYDPEEWEAYVQGKGDKPKSAVGKIKDKLGFDERARRNAAADKSANSNFFNRGSRERALNNAQAEYDQTALGRAENAFNRARDAVSGAAGRARDTVTGAAGRARDAVGRAADRAGDALGLDERERRDAAAEAASNSNIFNRGSRERAFNEAQAEYDRTLAGRAENAYNRARGAVDNAREAVSGAAGRARGAVDNAREAIGNAAESARGAVDNAREAIGNATESARGAVSNAASRVGEAAGRARDAVTGGVSDAITRAREEAAEVADRTYAREAKAAYDAAAREYEKVRGTGSDVELEAYWNMMNAQQALDRARGILG